MKLVNSTKKPMPKILWHRGSCDHCGIKTANVCHFGYDKPGRASYKICLGCMNANLQVILYGGLLYYEKEEEK